MNSRTTGVAVCLAALFAFPPRATADCPDAKTFVIAAEATVTRATGGPPHVDIPYSVPTTDGEWWLELQNSGADQLTVSIDGIRVIDTPDLRPNWTLIRAPVAPASSGTIQARVGSAPGASVWLRLIGIVPRSAGGVPVVPGLTIFGPQAFERQDPPEAEAAGISPPLEGIWWIRAEDAGSAQLSSITATIDGLDALRPEDVPAPSVERPVLVGSSSTLAVTVAGNPGAAATISVSGFAFDPEPPSISVIAPAADEWRNGGTIRIAYSDNFLLNLQSFRAFIGATDVTAAFTVSAGEATVSLADLGIEQGANTFITSICDAAGSEAEMTHTLLWDTRGPAIDINVKPNLEGSDPQVVLSRIPTIALEWHDPLPGIDVVVASTLRVLLDGVERTDRFEFAPDAPGSDWHFLRDEALLPGEHALEVEIQDALGNIGRRSAIFRIEPQPATHLAVIITPAPDQPLVAGVFYDLTVTALTDSELPAEAYAGTVRLSTTDARSTIDELVLAFTLDDFGSITVPDQSLFLTAGSHIVLAEDIENAELFGSLELTVAPGPPFELIALSGAEDQTLDSGEAPLPVVVRVLDAFGNLVPDVLVRLSIGGTAVEAQTDASGEATLAAGPLTGQGTLTAVVSIPGTEVPEIAYEIVLQATLVRGFVIDAGTGDGILGASVRIGEQAATTDIAGAFRIENLPPGTVSLFADGSAVGYNTATIPLALGNAPQEVLVRLVRLDPNGFVYVPRDATGMTLTGIDWTSPDGVRVVMPAGTFTVFNGDMDLRADVIPATAFPTPLPAGYYSFFALSLSPDGALFPAGGITLYVPNTANFQPGDQLVMLDYNEATGTWSQSPGTLSLTPDGEYIRIDGLLGFSAKSICKVAPGDIAFKGRVLSPDGRPVRNAAVTTGSATPTTTDKDGRYCLCVVSGTIGNPYTIDVTFKAADGQLLAQASVTLTPTRTITSVPDIQLVYKARLRGTILGPAGSANGASIAVFNSAGAQLATTPAFPVAARDGSYDFVVNVSPRVVTVQASALVGGVAFTGYAFNVTTRTLSTWPGTVNVPTIELFSLTTLTGRVVAPDGAGYVGAQVTMSLSGRGAGPFTTDSLGRYTASVDGPFSYVVVTARRTVTVGRPDLWASAVFTVSQRPGCTLELPDIVMARRLTPTAVHSGQMSAATAASALWSGNDTDQRIGHSVMAGTVNGYSEAPRSWESGAILNAGLYPSDFVVGGRRALVFAGRADDQLPVPSLLSAVFAQGLVSFPNFVNYVLIDSVVVGDVNGDNNPDLVIGSSQYDADAGRVWIVLGGSSWNFGNLVDLDAQSSVFFEGGQVHDLHTDHEHPGSKLGASIAVGDVNNDGIDDILIGSHGWDPHLWHGESHYHGRAYLVFGRQSWPSSSSSQPINLATATAATLPHLTFGTEGHSYALGHSVALLELNPDRPGLEVAIGADGFDGRLPGGTVLTRSGAVILYDPEIPDPSTLVEPANFFAIENTLADSRFGWPSYCTPSSGGRFRIIRASEAYTGFGRSIASLGNAVLGSADDRFDDLVVGSSTWASSTGRIWVLSGDPNYGLDGGLSRLADVYAFRSDGEAGGNEFGFSVAALGDIDGDQRTDFVVGAPRAMGTATDGSLQSQAGRAYLYTSRGTNTGWYPTVTYYGTQYKELLGYAVGSPGDVTGDHVPDVLVGAPCWDSGGIADRGHYFLLRPYVGELDADGDLLSRNDENALGTSDTNPDSDGDLVNDFDEIVFGTQILAADFPAPIVTAPIDNSTTSNAIVLVEGTTPLAGTVEISLNGAPAASFAVESLELWTSMLTLTSGPNTITVVLRQGSSVSPRVTRTVTLVPPSAPPATPTIASPAAGSRVNPALVSGVADPLASVEVFSSTASGGAAPPAPSAVTTASSSGSWSVPLPIATDGTYYTAARATDALGNISPLSGEVGFILDTQPPAIVINQPLDGASLPAGPFTVSGTSEAGAVVEIQVASVPAAFTLTRRLGPLTGAAWQFTIDAIPVGNHLITATATDIAGNQASTAVSISYSSTSFTVFLRSDALVIPPGGSIQADLVASDSTTSYTVSISGPARLRIGTRTETSHTVTGSRSVTVRATPTTGSGYIEIRQGTSLLQRVPVLFLDNSYTITGQCPSRNCPSTDAGCSLLPSLRQDGSELLLSRGLYHPNFEVLPATLGRNGLTPDWTLRYSSQAYSRYGGPFGRTAFTLQCLERLRRDATGNYVYQEYKVREFTFDRPLSLPGGAGFTADERYEVLYETTDTDGEPIVVMRRPDGSRLVFHAVDPASYTAGALKRCENRSGDTLEHEYDEFGRLTTIRDMYEREWTFSWDSNSRIVGINETAGLLGRGCRFSYDGSNRIENIVIEASNGTFTEKMFRLGYGTLTGDVALDTNIREVRYPNELQGGGANVPRVVNVYGECGEDYDRITSQTIGGTNTSNRPAGGALTYDYMTTQCGPVTAVTDRNGNITLYAFDSCLCHAIRVEERTNRNINPADLDTYVTIIEYNDDGEITRMAYPEMNEVRYEYDTTDPNRSAHGNLLRVTRLPGPRGDGFDGTPNPLVTSFTYEPIFQQVRTATTARGNDPGAPAAPAYVVPIDFDLDGAAEADPSSLARARYTTFAKYDYQEGDADANRIAALAQQERIFLSSRQAQALALPTTDRDPNNDGIVSQQVGRPVEVRQPVTSLASGGNQSIVTNYRWNAFGLLIAEIDPEGYVDEYFYGPDLDPDAESGSTSTGGYLYETVRDSTTAIRTPTYPTPRTAIRATTIRDAVGNIKALIDGRGIRHEFSVNERNMVVGETRAVDTLHYERVTVYDANDNVLQTFVENCPDPTALDASTHARRSNVFEFYATITIYDILDNPIVRLQATGRGDQLDILGQTFTVSIPSSPSSVETRMFYDRNENLVLVQSPESVLGNQVNNVAGTIFDERDLSHLQIRGGITADFTSRVPLPIGMVLPLVSQLTTTSVTKTTYNGSRAVVEYEDAENNGGMSDPGVDTTITVFDGFDRVVQTIDAFGYDRITEYDPDSNVVRQVARGTAAGNQRPQTEGEMLRLSESRSFYDEVGRAFRTETDFFTTPVAWSPGNPNPVTPFYTRTSLFDRNSRLVASTDARTPGNTTQMSYDGADRLISTTDAAGNEVRRSYDGNSNVVQTTEVEGPDTFYTDYLYDTANRQIRVVDNLGNARYTYYDSRNNVAATVDANGSATTIVSFNRPTATNFATNTEGNRIFYLHDGLGRQVAVRRELRQDHNGSNAAVVGYVETATDFDANSRVVSRTDDNSRSTTYLYDEQNRITRESFADWTFRTWDYDHDSNVTTFTDQRNVIATCTYDELNRLTSQSFDVTAFNPLNGNPVVATGDQAFEYDGLSRIARMSDGTTECVRSYDSVSRCIEEHQILSGATAVVQRAFDQESNQTSLTYPDSRVTQSTFDTLNRLDQVTEGVVTIADYAYTGPWRLTQRAYGNVVGAPLSLSSQFSYDGDRRVSQVRHSGILNAGPPAIPTSDMVFEYRYDREGRPLVENATHEMILIAGVPVARGADLYGYDSLYRLTEEVLEGRGATLPANNTPGNPPGPPDFLDVQTWALDGASNWATVQFANPAGTTMTTMRTVDEVNEYEEVVETDSTGTETSRADQGYDLNGNLTSDGGLFQFRYDALNRLVETVEADALGTPIRRTVLVWDAKSRLVQLIVIDELSAATLTNQRLIYDGSQAIEERDLLTAPNAYSRQFVYGLGGQCVQMRQPNGGGGTDVYYYLEKLGGSTVGVALDNRVLVEYYDYRAYGQVRVVIPGPDGKWFTGDEQAPMPQPAPVAVYLYKGLRHLLELGNQVAYLKDGQAVIYSGKDGRKVNKARGVFFLGSGYLLGMWWPWMQNPIGELGGGGWVDPEGNTANSPREAHPRVDPEGEAPAWWPPRPWPTTDLGPDPGERLEVPEGQRGAFGTGTWRFERGLQRFPPGVDGPIMGVPPLPAFGLRALGDWMSTWQSDGVSHGILRLRGRTGCGDNPVVQGGLSMGIGEVEAFAHWPPPDPPGECDPSQDFSPLLAQAWMAMWEGLSLEGLDLLPCPDECPNLWIVATEVEYGCFTISGGERGGQGYAAVHIRAYVFCYAQPQW